MLESKNHPAAAELKSYADKHGGIDKEYFHSAANHIASGRHRELAMHVKNGDTEPRDKVLDVLHKHDRPLSDKIHKAAGFERIKEGKKPGLWDNIHAKRKRIKAGSGERMRKPGSEGAPTAQDFKDASEDIKELSNKTLQSYMSKASDARGHRKLSTKKVDNRYKGVATASKKLAAESTDAYGKSMERIADKKKKDAITTSDKDKLKKLSDMMKRANEATNRYSPLQMAKAKKEREERREKETRSQRLTRKVYGNYMGGLKNEGAMSRLDVQRQERERLGKDKVKGSGLKTYKKRTSEPSRALSRMENVEKGTTMLSFMEVAGQRGRPKKGEGSESDKHIIMQLRSVQDLHRMGGDKHVQFSGGQKAKVHPKHVNAILQAHDKLNPDGKRRLRVAIGRHPQGLHKVATALTKKR